MAGMLGAGAMMLGIRGRKSKGAEKPASMGGSSPLENTKVQVGHGTE